eukprot:351840-Chlamydomonas_euryale.AAC.5
MAAGAGRARERPRAGADRRRARLYGGAAATAHAARKLAVRDRQVLHRAAVPGGGGVQQRMGVEGRGQGARVWAHAARGRGPRIECGSVEGVLQRSQQTTVAEPCPKDGKRLTSTVAVEFDYDARLNLSACG